MSPLDWAPDPLTCRHCGTPIVWRPLDAERDIMSEPSGIPHLCSGMDMHAVVPVHRRKRNGRRVFRVLKEAIRH